jgi:DNA ligase-1
VFQRLTSIAKTSGNQVSPSTRRSSPQSQAKKVGIINQLLSACQGNEAKFIIRSLEGKLRIGLAERSLVVALAHAIVLKDNREFHDRVRANSPRGQEALARSHVPEAG